MYCVYILTNYYNTVFYVGCTSNLSRRLREHKDKINERAFSKKYNLFKLVYYEFYENRDEAYRRERRLKRWYRIWKIALINKNNQNWEDLSYSFTTTLN